MCRDSLASIGVTGPKAARCLQAAGIELPPMKPLQVADLIVAADVPISVVRGGDDRLPVV